MGSSASHPPALPPRLEFRGWLADAALQDVFACLAAGGYETRAVGGAVRNSLLGKPIVDIDLATTARPDVVMRLAEAAGLQAIPTGIAHGTVTVVARRRAFEVTTLRRDIETDGRHARVTFSTDWSDDARRRDFTINALYCSADGTIHDPLGGWPDIKARRVRFIGEAAERIREDYLRILRFFRFTAEYVSGPPDAPSIMACEAHQSGIDGLSGERLRAEMMKLLVAPRAVEVTRIMALSGILERIAGPHAQTDALARLANIEAALGRQPSAILRLAALAAVSRERARDVGIRLRLSNAEAVVLSRAHGPDCGVTKSAPEADAKTSIYRLGREAFEEAVLLAWAQSGDGAEDNAWRARYELGERFPRPVLPVRGNDVVVRGVAPGPDVGRILQTFEEWWIAAGFPNEPAVISATLDAMVNRATAAGPRPLKPS